MLTAALVASAIVVAGWGWSPVDPRRLAGIVAAGTPESETPAADRATGHRRPRAADPAELATWCEAVARAVRGGTTLLRAITETEPPVALRDVLADLRLALERGTGLADALRAVDEVPRHGDLVVAVLRATAEHGGPPAEPLDRAAAALRQRAAIIAERRTQSAQARLSALVMTLLPGALLAVLVLTSPSVRSAVTTTPGLAAVGSGAVANLAGWSWMRHMIERGSRWG